MVQIWKTTVQPRYCAMTLFQQSLLTRIYRPGMRRAAVQYPSDRCRYCVDTVCRCPMAVPSPAAGQRLWPSSIITVINRAHTPTAYSLQSAAWTPALSFEYFSSPHPLPSTPQPAIFQNIGAIIYTVAGKADPEILHTLTTIYNHFIKDPQIDI